MTILGNNVNNAPDVPRALFRVIGSLDSECTVWSYNLLIICLPLRYLFTFTMHCIHVSLASQRAVKPGTRKLVGEDSRKGGGGGGGGLYS